MKTFKINLPQPVKIIIDTLQDHGYEAYAVGGCVRDALLGRTPEDWDITTAASPAVLKQLFRRTVDTGIAHGTVTVLLQGTGFEVTTYRIDGAYSDARHPDSVTFTRSLSEDLLRRDFTINAMAYNEKQGLVDLFGGQADLARGLVRCVGSAAERFQEDALRILRGVRFAAQLGFAIEAKTQDGMRGLAANLAQVSAERIQVELVKLLISPHPDILRLAWQLGLTQVFLPEFDTMMATEQETPHHLYNVGEHTLHALQSIRADKVLRLTMLLHDVGKPALKTIDASGVAHFKRHAVESERQARMILRRLKFDNLTVDRVTKLVRFHDYRFPATARSVRRALSRIGRDLFPDYLAVRRADVAAQSTYQRARKLQEIAGAAARYEEIVARGECTSVAELAVNGRDLIAAGLTPGPAIGTMLQQLLTLVLDEPERNNKEELLRAVQDLSAGRQGSDLVKEDK